MSVSPVSIEELSHLALSIGRILFQNNADTETVQQAVQRFAKVYDFEAHLLVTYETLLLTVDLQGQFRTKTGRRVPAMNVNMARIEAVENLLVEIENHTMQLGLIRTRIESIEREAPLYSKWVVILGLGLTAASLSRLFGGDWPTFFVVLVAALAGTALRLELASRGVNLFLTALASAFVSGAIAGTGVFLKFSDLPALCLITQGMILVPGVPFLNSVQDMIKNHMSIGLARLALAGMITLAIAMGLIFAAALTGSLIPLDEVSRLPNLAEDALFSAVAALGYLFLFNVPLRLAWVGVLCGVASHSTRTFCLLNGMDIVLGSFIGALLAGIIAHTLARRFHAPATAFAFPGVVAMIPGAFAFRAIVGFLEIIQEGAHASPALMAETLALTATCIFMVLAIAIGVAAPKILFKNVTV